MSEQYTAGVVVKGKVTGIQDYGAFVALDEATQGLVHISEITNGYVKDIHDFLKVGDTVEVKVLSIDEEHRKMSLSLKAAKGKQGKVLVPNPSDKGFNTLREKLTEWIEESQLSK
ncbi:RNA-binding protein [Bacillus pseudomycoides]|uniref:RNA-binding protein n=1 Tax=Bacillus pseudomycoides TaxID=64104 RepID=A0AA91VBI3_9BACI|nr:MULTISPECIES: S1 domain-containing post-transcriptional regulator GSP13 [Bacillus]PEB50552.1 RNA-binding protein [Bacillus sp. AFS098217]PED82004.1 RNA-binding protein [Bacillus pseudomycoides]PEU05692.1 RNA-binding protein [Bacillus sp. AFS019443]PEU10515.1 RNA-binding protein [Bacillus sp. AFS014408]PFW61172.1 RNA-binding protein [Bacillus sp. AFS075034]